MKIPWTVSILLGSLIAAPAALAQQDRPQDNQQELDTQDTEDMQEAEAEQENPKALIGKSFPGTQLRATDDTQQDIGARGEIRVVYVFDVASDLETNWYEPWQGENEAVLPTLQHLEQIHRAESRQGLQGQQDKGMQDENENENAQGQQGNKAVKVFALGAETFPGPTYGAQPNEEGTFGETDDAEDASEEAAERMNRIKEIRSKTRVTFPVLDAEPSRITADLDLEENVILIVDGQGKIKFAAYEGKLKDDQQDYLQQAIRQVKNNTPVTHPNGTPEE